MRSLLLLLCLVGVAQAQRLPTLVEHHKIPDFGAAAGSTIVADGDSLVVDSPAEHTTLGVHGSLTVSSKLTVDNLLVYADGTLVLQPGAEIVIKDTQIDTESDPHQWGTALIVLGNWTAHGENKTAYVRMTHALAVGDTTIQLESEPEGWSVGDELVIPRTRYNPSRTEKVVIQEIDGTTLVVTPCQFQHPGSSENPWGVELFGHIANLTRSIVIRSENPDGNRGHTVCTMFSNSDLTGVQFIGLGRTEAQMINNTVGDGAGGIHIGTNQIGRYADHFHHNAGTQRRVSCTYEDSRKWALTVHGTHDGVFDRIVAYKATGAGIATEDGTESGNVFTNSFVADVKGGWQVGDVRAGANQSSGRPLGSPNTQTGAESSGFWFRGPENTVENNVAYDCAGHAFNYNGYYGAFGHRRIVSFKGNEACTSRGALWGTWSQSCCDIDPYQRQVMEDFTAWNCIDGLHFFHESSNTFRNFTIIGDPSFANRRQGSIWKPETRASTGLRFGNNSYENFNTVFENLRVSGFNVGMHPPVNSGRDGTVLRNTQWANHIDIAFVEGAKPSSISSNVGLQHFPSLAKACTDWIKDADRTRGMNWPVERTHVWQEGIGAISLESEPGEDTDPHDPPPDPEPDPTPEPGPTPEPEPAPAPDPEPPAVVTAIVDGTVVTITGPVSRIELEE